MVNNINFINEFNKIIKNNYSDNYISRKYAEITYFTEILYILNSQIYWNRYKGSIPYKTIYNKHLEYIKKGYYYELFTNILNKYVSRQTYFIFKFQSIDTSFIQNKLGKHLQRNKYYKNKKGIKITSIVDSNGIPFSLLINECNKYDSTLLIKSINNCIINTNPKKYTHSNKYKQYFMADSGFDSKKDIDYLKENGYIPLIKQNIRNIKNDKYIRNMTGHEEDKYKKRIVVENSYAWIKWVPKLIMMFEKKSEHYLQLLYIAYSKLIFNRFIDV